MAQWHVALWSDATLTDQVANGLSNAHTMSLVLRVEGMPRGTPPVPFLASGAFDEPAATRFSAEERSRPAAKVYRIDSSHVITTHLPSTADFVCWSAHALQIDWQSLDD